MLKRLRRARSNQMGFTLIELLVVILIVGILAAVGVPLYLGYTRDAKLAEGKALAGSVFTALQACAQAKGGSSPSCNVNEVLTRVGLTSEGATGDGRWTVNTTGNAVLTSNMWVPDIRVAGNNDRDTANVALGMFNVNNAVVLRCTTVNNTPPASGTAGDPC